MGRGASSWVALRCVHVAQAGLDLRMAPLPSRRCIYTGAPGLPRGRKVDEQDLHKRRLSHDSPPRPAMPFRHRGHGHPGQRTAPSAGRPGLGSSVCSPVRSSPSSGRECEERGGAIASQTEFMCVQGEEVSLGRRDAEEAACRHRAWRGARGHTFLQPALFGSFPWLVGLLCQCYRGDALCCAAPAWPLWFGVPAR